MEAKHYIALFIFIVIIFSPLIIKLIKKITIKAKVEKKEVEEFDIDENEKGIKFISKNKNKEVDPKNKEELAEFSKRISVYYKQKIIRLINDKTLKTNTEYLKENDLIFIQLAFKKEGNEEELIFKFFLNRFCRVTFKENIIMMDLVSLSNIRRALIDLHYIKEDIQ